MTSFGGQVVFFVTVQGEETEPEGLLFFLPSQQFGARLPT